MVRFPDDVNVLANLDIYFDKTIEMAKWIKSDIAYCLTRWEDDGKGNLKTFAEKHGGYPGEWSQDAWVFTGDKIRDFKADFQLGKPGCDNHLAFLLNQAGFKLLNPALDIKAIHCHNYLVHESTNRRHEQVGDGKYLKMDVTHLREL